MYHHKESWSVLYRQVILVKSDLFLKPRFSEIVTLSVRTRKVLIGSMSLLHGALDMAQEGSSLGHRESGPEGDLTAHLSVPSSWKEWRIREWWGHELFPL